MRLRFPYIFHLMEFLKENQDVLLYSGAILVVLVIGYFRFRNEIMFLFSKEETEGVITNWMSATQEGKRYFYPVIEFRTAAGEKITFRADERSENSPMFQPGTKVVIRYLPKKPDIRKVIYPS